MALGAALSAFTSGNFQTGFGYLFTPQSAIDTTNQVAAAQNALIQQKVNSDRDLLAQDQNAQTEADMQKWQDLQVQAVGVSPSYATAFNDPMTSPWVGFEQGAAQGLANEQNLVKGTLNTVAGGILGALPWWIYALAALAGLYYAWPFLSRFLKTR